jgi:hypothetical protein
MNAYVTFRDIQARNKVVGREDFKVMDLPIKTESSVDPKTILWENLGMPEV